VLWFIGVLRKRLLQPDTIGLIPKGGYTANHKQSKKALMWLVHRKNSLNTVGFYFSGKRPIIDKF